MLSKDAAKKNLKGMRKAMKHLRNDGMLLVFPAGQVSSLNIRKRRIEDRPWDRLVGQLAATEGAVSVPIHVKGKNSRLFYLLGLIHPRLRTLMLARELSNKQGSELRLKVGEPVTQTELRKLPDSASITHYLRMSTDLLGVAAGASEYRQAHAIDMPRPGVELLADIDRLREYRLLERKAFEVYCAPFDALGSVAEQIGIAREITFRAAGEGTGNQIDIDQFDAHYLHLFIWDRERHTVAGGYRIGRVDEIVAEHGIDGCTGGLCTGSIRPTWIVSVRAGGWAVFCTPGLPAPSGSAGFVVARYWQIRRAEPPIPHAVRRGQYFTRSFGYGALADCREYAAIASCGRQVSGRCGASHAVKTDGKIWTDDMLKSLSQIAVLNKLVGRCDPGKTLPILIRHYLSLNGKFVCFSVNTVFNDSLDGLILVDMRKMPERYLVRYLGKDGAETFTSHWRK